MPLSWLSAEIPDSYRATYRDKALAAYRGEVKQRAELLRHLGYSAKEVTARCRAHLRWDFDLSGHCPVEDEVQKIVQAVFKKKA